MGIKSIQASLLREFGRNYKRPALYYALKVRLGYVYKKPKDLRVAMSPKRKAQLRKHWLQRDLALKLQKAGEAILYYVDESYIHQNHFPEDCWFHPDRPDVVRPAGKGQRLVIVHAISLEGLAFQPDADGNPPRPDEFDSSVCDNAEMIFRAKSARGDYHDNYDTDTFIMWMERRMLPAFKAKHGDEKTLVLVLDNAPYHHGRCDDGFFPKEHSKAEIAAKLLSLRCRSLDVMMRADPKKQVPQPEERPTHQSAPELFIGWYMLDVDDSECFEVTHMEEDVSEFEQGTVLTVTKMAVQRGTKSWFSIDKEKAAAHGLQTFADLVEEGTLQIVGFGDEAYVRISQFWRRYMAAPRRDKPDPRELLDEPDDVGDGEPRTHTYPARKLAERYNGRGDAGTGGPKLFWLREAATKWIAQHHPELLDTRLMRFCRGKNIQLVFTAPYEFDSQPIENVWRDVKAEVARRYYPGRTITATRDQLIHAFYTRITPEFCTKLILGTEKYLNDQIQNDDEYKHLGRIGEFVDPPSVHRSDEIIDLTCLEDDHDDDMDDEGDC